MSQGGVIVRESTWSWEKWVRKKVSVGYKYTVVGDMSQEEDKRGRWVKDGLDRNTWHLRRLGNAGKRLFRLVRAIIRKLNIHHFEPPDFGRPPKQSAENAKKCTIDSFPKAEDDHTKLDNFHELFGHNKISGLSHQSKVRIFTRVFM